MNARASFGLVAAAVTFTLVGCGGGDAAKAPAAKPTGAAVAPAAAAAEFGVPECDEYFKKYLACIDTKVPEAARAQVRQSLDQTKATWKQAAATPEGKSALAMGCTQATATAKTAMSAYGCTW